MTPAKIFYQIRSDKTYLLKSYLLDTLVMVSLISVLYKTQFGVNMTLGPVTLFATVIMAMMNGYATSSLLHNSSHKNIPTTFMNRIIGEYCGYWVLYGFKNFTMVHILHHKYSDDEFDPVNPHDMSFMVFVFAPMRYMIKAAKKYLYSIHGDKSHYETIMKTQVGIFHLNLLLRLTIWYLLLGKTLFLAFFVPSFMSIVFVFAHVNYVCHRNSADGSVEIVNLNHNLYYKLANILTMGGYFHKNHHINMKIFNPKSFQNPRVSVQYLTIRPKEVPIQEFEFQGSLAARYLSIHNVWGESMRNRVLAGDKPDRHTTHWL